MDLSHPLSNLVGENIARILRRLATVSDELTGRRIAEVSAVPVVSASRVLADLAEIGLVSTRDVGQSRLYRLNRGHVLWNPLEAIMASPAIIEQCIGETVNKQVGQAATVAVFGSFARGEAGPQSDIDVVIVWEASVPAERRARVIDDLQERIPAMTGNRLELVEIDEDDLARMARAEDPLVESWQRESRTVSIGDLKARIREVTTR